MYSNQLLILDICIFCSFPYKVDILLVVTLLIRTDQDSIRVEVLVSGLKDELAVFIFKEPGFRI